MNASWNQIMHSLIKTKFFGIFKNKKLQTHTDKKKKKKKKTSVPLVEKSLTPFVYFISSLAFFFFFLGSKMYKIHKIMRKKKE